MKKLIKSALSGSALLLSLSIAAPAQQANMTFFVTSSGPGKGADLGGLEGADRHCQTLAQAAGAGGKTWRAYLSTQGAGAVNAKDRIGRGPWQNAKGAAIAKDVAELHGSNNLTKQTALTEKGEPVNGRGDTPNMHDILTGSPVSVSAVCFEILFAAPCSSSTLCAMTSPLAFCHGPRPMRSRALTAPAPCVER